MFGLRTVDEDDRIERLVRGALRLGEPRKPLLGGNIEAEMGKVCEEA